MENPTPPPCATCFHRRWCVPSACSAAEADESMAAVHRGVIRVRRGQTLSACTATDAQLFIVRSGAFKSQACLHPRAVRVVGLHESGDIMAVECLLGRPPCAQRIALQDSVACAIDIARLRALSMRQPTLSRYLAGLALGSLTEAHQDMFALGCLSATERMARLLAAFSRRRRLHGRSPGLLNLPFSRRDIGSHLALRIETVSRALTTLEQSQVIRRSRGMIQILDAQRLDEMAAFASPRNVLPAVGHRVEHAMH